MTIVHPLADVGLSIENFKCFGKGSGELDVFRPINVVIGRNNSGKSALIDAIELCVTQGKSFDRAKHARMSGTFKVKVSQPLDEESLASVFPQGARRGAPCSLV